jgi:hypothetical protein
MGVSVTMAQHRNSKTSTQSNILMLGDQNNCRKTRTKSKSSKQQIDKMQGDILHLNHASY